MFGSAASWKQSLNPSQLEAVTCGDGPVLVIAGAGTGKTWTLACRVAYLIEQGVSPERILLLTFSRRAAREMLSRAGRLVDRAATGKVWGGTFHAIANRLLRLFGHPLGLSPDFTVLDQTDMADLMDLIRGEHHPASDRRARRFPRKDTLAAIYSRMVNASQPLSATLETAFPWCSEDTDGIRAIFETYASRKRSQNLVDYDDLLVYWRALLTTDAGRQAARQFDHVLVDEYQDTNPLQAHILQGMRVEVRNLMVVGDDAQAIYGFRSASVRNILDFPVQFPGAHVIKLEQNYRSTAPILDVSNAVIACAPERFTKNLRSVRGGGARPVLVTCSDEAEQSGHVCEQVLQHREQGTMLRDQAVLFRSGHHSDALELELTRRNIPFVKYGGLKFLESAHVKDVLAVLRLLENPRDEVSWFRVLQLLDGVGPAAARRMMDLLGVRAAALASLSRSRNVSSLLPSDDRDSQPPLDEGMSPIRRLIDSPPSVPESARDGLARLRDALSDCVGNETSLSPAAEIARIRAFCEPVFEQRYSNADARLNDVDQLESVAGAYTSRGRFLAELALDPPTSTSDLAGPPLLDEDYLILSTVHSAKGGEWDVVHVIHAADGMIPSDMATGNKDEVEEERRLFYVALTRARDYLYVYFPLRFYRRPRGLDDAHHFAQLTRFLPPAVQSLFERRTAGISTPYDPLPPDAPSGRRTRAEVDRELAALWEA